MIRRLPVVAVVTAASMALTVSAVAAAETTTATTPTAPTTTDTTTTDTTTVSATSTDSVPAGTDAAAVRVTSTSVSTTTTAVAHVAVAGRQARTATSLGGVLALTSGTCAGAASGTYFRMLQPGGRPNGPASGYLVNADSPCADKTYTPLSAGTDGGLALDSYQPEPTPAFDGQGNALASRIVEPARFFGIRFSLATAPADAQTGATVDAPALAVDGSRVRGDLRALDASWNRGHFNQGAPKPDGSTPGLTTVPSGPYDPATGALTVEWTSSIVGGPFNGFTGEWHFAGHVASAAPGAHTDPAPASDAATSDAEAATASTLASTGTQSGSVLVVGLLLVAVGATALLLAGQRRRPVSPDVGTRSRNSA